MAIERDKKGNREIVRSEGQHSGADKARQHIVTNDAHKTHEREEKKNARNVRAIELASPGKRGKKGTQKKNPEQ